MRRIEELTNKHEVPVVTKDWLYKEWTWGGTGKHRLRNGAFQNKAVYMILYRHKSDVCTWQWNQFPFTGDSWMIHRVGVSNYTNTQRHTYTHTHIHSVPCSRDSCTISQILLSVICLLPTPSSIYHPTSSARRSWNLGIDILMPCWWPSDVVYWQLMIGHDELYWFASLCIVVRDVCMLWMYPNRTDISSRLACGIFWRKREFNCGQSAWQRQEVDPRRRRGSGLFHCIMCWSCDVHQCFHHWNCFQWERSVALVVFAC